VLCDSPSGIRGLTRASRKTSFPFANNLRPLFTLSTLPCNTAMVPPLPLRALLSTKCVQPSFFVSAFESLPRRFQIRSSTIASPLRPYLTRRFYYGQISDPKMAPQLEPFFRQYVTYSRPRESRLDADTDPENRVDDLSGSFIERTWSGFLLS
jgi:hypothetical protein